MNIFFKDQTVVHAQCLAILEAHNELKNPVGRDGKETVDKLRIAIRPRIIDHEKLLFKVRNLLMAGRNQRAYFALDKIGTRDLRRWVDVVRWVAGSVAVLVLLAVIFLAGIGLVTLGLQTLGVIG